MDSAFDPYISQLDTCDYFKKIIRVPDIRNRKVKGLRQILSNIFFYRKNVNEYFRQFINHEKLIRLIGDSEVNVFSTTLLFQKYLFFNFPNNYFRILEDGLIVYRKINNPITRIIKIIHNIPDRPSDHIFKEIWVSNPKKLPNKSKIKAKAFDINLYIQQLNQEQKNALADFFLNKFELINTTAKTILVITQPLSEDGFISEEYKIHLYKKIIEGFQKDGYKIYLKSHPREKTQYDKTISEIDEVISGNFPLEILNLNPLIKFDKGITIFSSALNNCDFIGEKIFLGENWDSKIYAELQKRFKM